MKPSNDFILRNNVALFGWGFSVFFLLMCTVFSYILIRDGASSVQIYPPDIPDYYPVLVPLSILGAFWLAGLGLANFLAGIPCVRVEVSPDRVTRVEKRFPFRKELAFLLPTEVASVELLESRDSDGDPYFMVRLLSIHGLSCDIAEGSDRSHCEDILARFRMAIGI